MAIWNIVSIHDQAINAYMRPWAVPHTGAALRNFGDEVNSKEPNDLNKHPSDYTLWDMAYYNDATGEITQADGQPRMMARAVDYKEKT